MGSTDYGNQVKSVGFYDPADSGVVNKRNVSVQERGIYYGGYLTLTAGNDVSLSPLICIIGDSAYQLRIETTTAVTKTLDSTNKYVILRWSYTGAAATDYMDVLAVASGDIQTNDLLVGIGTFSGSSLTGVQYVDSTRTYIRSEAMSPSRILKVLPTVTPSLSVRINPGYVNYGTTSVFVPTQQYGPFTAPTGNPRIDLLYVDSSGVIQRTAGTEAASPVAPSYANKIVLAEIRLTVGMTTITQSAIRDTRLIIGAGTDVSSLYPSLAGNGGKFMRVNLTETGFEYSYPTYAP